MDWESKFSSIVRETESNLAKVKQRLGPSRTLSQTNPTLPANGAASYSPGLQYNSSIQPITGLHSAVQPFTSLHTSTAPDPTILPTSGVLFTSGTSPAFRHTSGLETAAMMNGLHNEPYSLPLSLEQSPGVLSLLSDKIDAQTTAIQSLTRIVNRLEEEKEHNQQKIKGLKDELSRVHTRMSERGVDLQTERKIEQWRRDVANEMHHLQTQLKHRTHTEDDGRAQSLVKEIYDMKKYFQDEMNFMRRDLETLKSRVVRVEGDVTGLLSDNREIGRRHQRLEQITLDLNEDRHKHPMNPVTLSRNMSGRNIAKSEITELKSSLKMLENKLGTVEAQVQKAKSKPVYPRRRTKQTLLETSTADLLSPYSSDLDLSDFSTDDLDDDLKPSYQDRKKGNEETSHDLDLPDDDNEDVDDLNLTTDDLLSTGIDTEDLI